MHIKKITFKNFLTFEKDKDIVLDFTKNSEEMVSTLVLLGSNCSGKTALINLVNDFFEFLFSVPHDWLDKEDLENAIHQAVGNLFTPEQLRHLLKLILTTYTFFQSTFVVNYSNEDVVNLHEQLSPIMNISFKQCEDIIIHLCNLFNNKKVNRWLRRRRVGTDYGKMSITFHDDRIGDFTCSIEDNLFDENSHDLIGNKVESYEMYLGKFNIDIVGENNRELSQKELETIIEKILDYKENIHVKLPDKGEKWTENINMVINDLYHWIGEQNLLTAIRLFMPQATSIGWINNPQLKQNGIKFVEYINLSNGVSKIMINDLPYAIREFLTILNYLISYTTVDEGLIILDNLGCLLDLDKVKILSSIMNELKLNRKSQFIYTIKKLDVYDALYKDKKVYFLDYNGFKQTIVELDPEEYDSKKIKELMEQSQFNKKIQPNEFIKDVVRKISIGTSRQSNRLKS